MPDIAWTTEGILSALYAIVAVMIIVVLYHTLFVVVDIRRIVRRVEHITRELQAVLLKPLALTDEILQWITNSVQKHSMKKEKKAEFKKHKV